MQDSSVRPTDVLEHIMNTYGNMLFRYAFILLGNAEDAEDVIQDTLFKYWQKAPEFQDAEHEKAWLLTVTANRCRDKLRFRKRYPVVDLESVKEPVKETEVFETSGILEILMTLPEKYKTVLYLYYVEEYRVGEIATMIGRTTSAVKMRLKKGRQLLSESYRKEYR